jgi:Flp pilus assembly protein TadD
LARRGETAQAAESYRRALALANDNARAAVGLARTLVAAGDLAEVPRLLDSPSLRPPADNAADVANETARIGAQISSRDPATAVRLYRRAIDFDPRCRIAWNNLAWMLATSPDPAVRNGPEAVRAAASLAALDLEPDPITLDTVAAAYAEAGRWSEAVSAAEQAVDLAGRRGLRERDELQGRLELYRAGQPFRQPRRTN